MAQPHRAFILPEREGVPPACAKSVLQQLPEGLHWVILCSQRRGQINFASSLSDSCVQLIILVPDQFFVVQSHTVENFSSERSKRNRVDKSFLTAGAKLGITDTKRTTQNGRHKLRSETIICGNCHPRSADIVGTSFFQVFHAVCSIVARVDIVAIGTDDHFSARSSYADVHGRGNDARGIIQATDMWILTRNLLDNLPRSVRRPPIHYDDFEVTGGIVLLHQGLQARADVFLFVPYRHSERYCCHDVLPGRPRFGNFNREVWPATTLGDSTSLAVLIPKPSHHLLPPPPLPCSTRA